MNSLTFGILVDPPIKITSFISPFEICLFDNAVFIGICNLSNKGWHASSNSLLVIFSHTSISIFLSLSF